MGIKIRKSVKLGKGVKVNLNKKSVGITLGDKGMHYTINSSGRKTTSAGIPGTGIYYSSTQGGSKAGKSAPKLPEYETGEAITAETDNISYSAPAPHTPPENTKYCPYCGKPLFTPDSVFCIECGREIVRKHEPINIPKTDTILTITNARGQHLFVSNNKIEIGKGGTFTAGNGEIKILHSFSYGQILDYKFKNFSTLNGYFNFTVKDNVSGKTQNILFVLAPAKISETKGYAEKAEAVHKAISCRIPVKDSFNGTDNSALKQKTGLDDFVPAKKNNKGCSGCGCAALIFIAVCALVGTLAGKPQTKNTTKPDAPETTTTIQEIITEVQTEPATEATQSTTAEPAPAPTPEPEPAPAYTPAYNSDQNADMVYIGATGTKYHKQSCPTLKGGGTAITRAEALAQGREPCKRCHPY